jgi:DNA-binding transcriptional ArsR family regulator
VEFSSEPGIVEGAPPTSAPVSIGPRWESADALNEAHLGSMNDAERLVVSIAGQREISPSDTEIQARLEVGRPRLSQIYNALQRSGILSVRKEGRSRLFKLSDAAAEMLP